MNGKEAIKMLRTIQETVFLGKLEFYDAIDVAIKALKNMPSAQSEVAKDINVPNNDTISRQAAIDALRRAEALTRAFGYHNVIDTIRELPSEQPEIIRCKDCKWWDKYGENHGYCMRVRRWGEYFCADAERREE